jgi:hypothetical protein
MHLFDPQVAPCPPDALCCMNCDEAKVQVLAQQRQMYIASCLKRILCLNLRMTDSLKEKAYENDRMTEIVTEQTPQIRCTGHQGRINNSSVKCKSYTVVCSSIQFIRHMVKYYSSVSRTTLQSLNRKE